MGEIKYTLSRWLLSNKVVFRFEEISSFLTEMFRLSNGPICFRRLGQFLSGFTHTDGNSVFQVWSELGRANKAEWVSVPELKLKLFLLNSRRHKFDRVTQAVERYRYH